MISASASLLSSCSEYQSIWLPPPWETRTIKGSSLDFVSLLSVTIASLCFLSPSPSLPPHPFHDRRHYPSFGQWRIMGLAVLRRLTADKKLLFIRSAASVDRHRGSTATGSISGDTKRPEFCQQCLQRCAAEKVTWAKIIRQPDVSRNALKFTAVLFLSDSYA